MTTEELTDELTDEPWLRPWVAVGDTDLEPARQRFERAQRRARQAVDARDGELLLRHRTRSGAITTSIDQPIAPVDVEKRGKIR